MGKDTTLGTLPPSGATAPGLESPVGDSAITDGRLSAHHLADLRGSGLSDETITRAGLRTITDPLEIGRVLGWGKPVSTLGPCLYIPFPDPLTGKPNGFARLKPTRQRPGGGKYEQPKGAGLRAYFTPGAIEAIRNPPFVVGFTEGEKKALAADQAGCPCIGLTGVFSWQKKREDKSAERQLIEDLAGVAWEKSTIWICFDTDEVRKPQVNHARAELARVLQNHHGARVVFVDLPIARGCNN
ncbi:MAG: DUF3854 domain-containing protein [Thermoguttaceae bacterium]